MLAARGGHLLRHFPLVSERSPRQALIQKA
jgi:hypothetical protein